ncbi:MAG: sulfur carrier protein ThiS [Verrucomicrobiales bacterium]|nr:sulfur carrier protein ThiS [Verrucomicrobiales bacterium]
MQLVVNGSSMNIDSDELSITEFIKTLPIGDQPVLVELNGEAVLTREFDERTVRDGDKLEVIRMVAGG